MKNKYLILTLIFVAAVAVGSKAFAEEGKDFESNNNVGVKVQVGAGNDSEDFRLGETSSVRFSSTSSREREGDRLSTSSREREDDRSSSSSKEIEDNRNASTSEEGNRTSESDEHRSVVANFVKSLLNVADREGGIGKEVREVARAQNDSATTTAEAMRKVDNRGALRTFLFGADYKNLGVIRSELATASSSVEKLQNLLSRTVSASDKAEIEAQIKVLKDEQAKVEAYVNSRESVFSLFGWFNKLFSK
ncbi:hypothetical protein IT397_02310 [Candidatus Nomurabacteria bacterium]|nr:hypothetical protein [Candidatus Nomurabacteria bacterium]